MTPMPAAKLTLLFNLCGTSLALAAGPTVSPAEVPASGRQEAIASAPTFGRYAMIAESEQGTSLQVVDRMAGPGPTDGSAGTINGRRDEFLEPGEVKLVLHSHRAGTGKAKVSMHSFIERNGENPPRLVKLKSVQTSLGDFEQRSYWLDLGGSETISIEAAGRYLHDLRFWREGTWLHEAKPTCEPIEQQPGLPRTLCNLHASLEAGLYLVTAYGGAPLPWAETPEDPKVESHLFLRWDIPSLSAAGRQRFTIGPVGLDRHRVPNPAAYFRVELAKKAPATLQVSTPGTGNPYTRSGRRAAITDESRLPVAEVSNSSSSGTVVTVFGTPGQEYILQHFEPLRSGYHLYEDGYYYAATLHAGDPADSIDPTALIYSAKRKQVIPQWSRALKVGSSTRYHKRFNLLEAASMFIELEAGLELGVATKGTKAKVRVEPVLLRKPRGYRAPAFVNTSLRKKLDAGFYHVTIQPTKPGIVELTISGKSWTSGAKQFLGMGDAKKVSLPPALTWDELYLIKREKMTLLIANQPGVRVGMVLREKPLSIAHAIPLVLAPNQSWSQEIKTDVSGTLRAVAEDGKSLPLTVNGRSTTSASVRAGRIKVKVSNSRRAISHANLVLVSDAMRPQNALPVLSASRLKTLPKFPDMRAEQPVHATFGRSEQKTWLLRVKDPSLYRLETTGLLATEGNVRTRIHLGFAKGGQNGVGRNFLVERYLRSGTYQVSVRTLGRSRGHLGVRLRRTGLLDGGQLRDRIPGRITVPAGRAVRYTFEVAEAGTYRIESYGQHQIFQCRIEDSGQWPLMAPLANCDQTLELWPGTFAVIVQPTTTESRRVTRITRQRSRVALEGHGPHLLPFDRGQTHVWYEPREGQERVPDAWTFELPATAHVTLSVTAPMRGTLLRTDAAANKRVGETLASKAFDGQLAAGTYRVEVTAVRKNNKVPYTVALKPRQLLAGMTRSVLAPSRTEISVGDGRLVELSSMGRADVRGRLYDEKADLVAANDDRPDEWNFRITRRLAAGNYWLQIDSVGQSSGSTEVEMRTPTEKAGKALAPGENRTLRVGNSVIALPLTLPEDHPVLIAQTDANENIGAAIEVRDGNTWRAVGDAVGPHNRIAIRAFAEPREYRLRVWSLDQRDNPIAVKLYVPDVDDISEGSFESGEHVELDDDDPPFEIVQVESDPGLFTIETAPAGALFCPSMGRACEPLSTTTFAAEADGLWWASPVGELRGHRVDLKHGESTHALLEPDRITQLNIDDDQEGPTALVVRTAAGHPGISLHAHEGRGMPDARMVAVSGAAAVAVDLSGEREVAVAWSGSSQALLGKITAHRFGDGRTTDWGWGPHREDLAASSSLKIAMPSLAATLSLSLSPGVIAVIPTAEGHQTFWADRRAQHVQVAVHGESVFLLNASDETSVIAAEVFPAGEMPLEPVAAGMPYECMATRSRVTRVPVAADPVGYLETMGEFEAAFYLRQDGRIFEADGAPVGPGGMLELHHRPGGSLVWVERPSGGSGNVLGPWSQRTDTVQYTITAPTQIQLNDVSQRFVFALRDAMMAHVRVPAPAVAQIQIDGARSRTQMLRPGDSLNLWLPKGKGSVEVRGIGQTRLWGLAELGMSVPTSIGEGLGPQVLLSPGGSQVFSFDVKEAGKVGVGVLGEADWVSTELLDARGNRLGKGLLQMPELEVGTYILALSLPTGADPVKARPALAGVERPDDTPPKDVIRGYLQQAGYLEGGR